MIKLLLGLVYEAALLLDLVLLAADEPVVLGIDLLQLPLLHLQTQVLLDQTCQTTVELLPTLVTSTQRARWLVGQFVWAFWDWYQG